ncbi:MAG: HDIG domain-containing protein [Myxococcales bacterium]|nr:HDIG domain-containing protein [Myxococcales bacterium]
MTEKSAGITRENAYALLAEKLAGQPRLINHCLATEAILRDLAPRFGADPEFWGIGGLLHDIDLGEVGDDMRRHAEVGAGWLDALGVHPEITLAIRKHNDALGLPRATTYEHALAAAETVTGLIIATALVYPDKKLASVKPKSVAKRYKEKLFAAGADRAIIAECETIGVPLAEFLESSLASMTRIADQLGL